jgi:Ribbon-helix-helix protein, copG family
MQATVELTEAVLRRLEALARQEGATTADMIRRLVEAHVKHIQSVAERSHDVRLPLIQASETGSIQPLTGAALDELLTRHDLTA